MVVNVKSRRDRCTFTVARSGQGRWRAVTRSPLRGTGQSQSRNRRLRRRRASVQSNRRRRARVRHDPPMGVDDFDVAQKSTCSVTCTLVDEALAAGVFEGLVAGRGALRHPQRWRLPQDSRPPPPALVGSAPPHSLSAPAGAADTTNSNDERQRRPASRTRPRCATRWASSPTDRSRRRGAGREPAPKGSPRQQSRVALSQRTARHNSPASPRQRHDGGCARSGCAPYHQQSIRRPNKIKVRTTAPNRVPNRTFGPPKACSGRAGGDGSRKESPRGPF